MGKENIKEFWRKKESPKHRYIQVLGQNKSEKRKLTKQLKHKVSPYPKNPEEFIAPVERHETYEPENKVSFW